MVIGKSHCEEKCIKGKLFQSYYKYFKEVQEYREKTLRPQTIFADGNYSDLFDSSLSAATLQHQQTLIDTQSKGITST